MSIGTRIKRSSAWLAVIVFLLAGYALPAFGEEEKTVDQYISEAAPYLHLSCEYAWEASGEDPDEYVAIINRFVAIVFINHDFDIQRIDDARDDLIALTRDLIRIPTLNPPGDCYRDICAYLDTRLKGFSP